MHEFRYFFILEAEIWCELIIKMIIYSAMKRMSEWKGR